MFLLRVASYRIFVRLRKEGFNFQMWVTSLQATQSQIHRLKMCFLPNTFWHGQEKNSSVAVQKGLLISPVIPRRWFEGLEQLSTFQVAQSEREARVASNEAVPMGCSPSQVSKSTIPTCDLRPVSHLGHEESSKSTHTTPNFVRNLRFHLLFYHQNGKSRTQSI